MNRIQKKNIHNKNIHKKKLKKKLIKSLLMVVFTLWILTKPIGLFTADRVSAAMKSVTLINLTHPGQVIDTITYNGVTVEAVYSNVGYTGNDPTYSCAAFIKNFYQAVYGINVYNLHNSTSVPLVYDNKGSFALTTKPQIGDIVRDNTRTHWAIVKSISGNTITVIQQSYKSGSKAWINCTIELGDKDFSYFTYSERIPDNAEISTTSDIIMVPEIEVPEKELTLPGDYSMVSDGTYHLIQASSGDFIQVTETDFEQKVQAVPINSTSEQLISIVNHGMNQYSLRFHSNQSYLSISDENKMITAESPIQKYTFVLRESGWYTISPVNDHGKVIASLPKSSQEGTAELILRDFTGSMNEYWYLIQVDSTTLPILPQVAVNKKTLYTGYQSYPIKIKDMTNNAFRTYTSTNPSIASVDLEGNVKPLKKGKADIIVKIIQQNITYEYTVAITVKDPYINITTTASEVKAGKSITMKAKGYGTDQAFTWQVSDQTIAKIDPKSGKLTAVKKGEVTVTARHKEGYKVSKKMLVK